ncbi:MAG: hypothetical protein AB1297_05785 [bacterium]
MKKVIISLLLFFGITSIIGGFYILYKRKPYLDVIDAKISPSNEGYIDKIIVGGNFPVKSPKSISWDTLIDSDRNINTGWGCSAWEESGIDYVLRLELKETTYKASMLDIKVHKWKDIKFKLKNNIAYFYFSPSDIGNSKKFNYIVITRKPVIPKKKGYLGYCKIFAKFPDKRYNVFPDTDKDGFADDEELNVYKTNPNLKEKWDDLKTVTHILNTPEKINLYLKQRFLEKGIASDNPDVKKVFKEMAGDCDEYAILATYWLAKNGYKAYFLKVDFDDWWGGWSAHDICIYKEKDGRWYTIDFYFYVFGDSNPSGPFKSIEEICDQAVSHYDEVTRWTEYELWTPDYKLIRRGKPTKNP